MGCFCNVYLAGVLSSHLMFSSVCLLGALVPQDMCKSEDNLQDLVLSFHRWAHTQVIRPGGKVPHLSAIS